jgi:iron complex transport system ATP-binding protein
VATPLLSSSGLSYAIDGRAILRDVTLAVEPGQLLGLVGPNGSGKTTLLKSLTRLLQTEGVVTLDGRDLNQLGERAIAQKAARVPQSTSHDGGFTAEEIVLAGRAPHLGWLQPESPADHEIVADAMRVTATEPFADRPAAELSGGERQRVFLARAIAQQPQVMLLDEPTANLDVAHQLRVLDLVRQLTREGLAAIAAIHDLSLASRYCDALVLLHHGQVVAQGSPASVITPDNLAAVYGVRAVVERNPHAPGLTVSILEALS